MKKKAQKRIFKNSTFFGRNASLIAESQSGELHCG